MTRSVKQNDMERLARYRDTLCAHPRLTYLFFELTDACNLSCLHCGSSACPQNSTYLPTEAVLGVMEQVAAKYPPRSVMICLSGGEPMLHPGLEAIVSHSRRLGFSCGMTSNGLLMDEAAAAKLVACGLESVSFSLDGLEDTHDWFRNRPGAFRQSVQGIQHFLKAAQDRALTQVTTVIHQKNYHQLEDICQFVARLGVGSWRAINLEPIGRALQHRELLLTPQQLRGLLRLIRDKRYDPQVHMDVTYGCSHYLTEPLERIVRDTYFLCGSGIMVASVLCNGDIYSCMDIERRPELVQGNIFRDSFVDVWENRFKPFREDRTERCDRCRQCADRRFCRGDSAHTWDYEQHQPMLCMKQLLSMEGE